MIERRKFLTGLVSLIAAPAIVRAGSLMPVKADRVSMSVVDIINAALRRAGDAPYGRSPAMEALPYIRAFDLDRAKRYAQVVWTASGPELRQWD